MLILGLLGMYFDATVVFVTNSSLLFRLAVPIHTVIYHASTGQFIVNTLLYIYRRKNYRIFTQPFTLYSEPGEIFKLLPFEFLAASKNFRDYAPELGRVANILIFRLNSYSYLWSVPKFHLNLHKYLPYFNDLTHP